MNEGEGILFWEKQLYSFLVMIRRERVAMTMMYSIVIPPALANECLKQNRL